MTKAEILAELRAKFTEVAPPELLETVGTVNRYLFLYLATGTDQDGSPVAHKMNRVFYIRDEGQPQETAYHEDTAPDNRVDRNVVAANPAAPTALEIQRLYTSQRVRDRVMGLMVRAANDINKEAPADPNHAQRLKWALSVMSDVGANINIAMSFVSMNALILGGAWTDEDLRFIVNSNIDKWAVALYS